MPQNLKNDMMIQMERPLVIDIKGNSLDDGPGIRSTVFFKGCPLSCAWCHNPESKKLYAELSYDRTECIGCGSCVAVCQNGALGKVPSFIDRNACKKCFACTKVCPSKALARVGNEMTVEEIYKKVASDKPFFDVSGGGVTLSGGEATVCAEWVGGLAKMLHENGIHVLLETCGFFDFEKVKQYILPYLTDIYCDIKIFDKEKHKNFCGVDNTLILDNFKKMWEYSEVFGYHLLPRVPLVPDITDTEENLLSIADYLASIGVKKAQLLPYNPTWYKKADKLGASIREEIKNLTSWQDKDKVEQSRNIFRVRHIDC